MSTFRILSVTALFAAHEDLPEGSDKPSLPAEAADLGHDFPGLARRE